MPNPTNPSAPEFFVYRLEAMDIPFYVGIGRSARASDRVRFVNRLLEREANGHFVRWSLSTSVIAAFIKLGTRVRVRYTRKRLTRGAALLAERRSIAALLARGYALANQQLNPSKGQSAASIVSSVQQRAAGA